MSVLSTLLKGFRYMFDLTGYIESNIPDDYTAIESDWKVIGDDIRKAMKEVDNEIQI